MSKPAEIASKLINFDFKNNSHGSFSPIEEYYQYQLLKDEIFEYDEYDYGSAEYLDEVITEKVIDYFDEHIGICGCGCPDETYKLIYNVLMTCSINSDDFNSFDEYCQYKQNEINKITQNYGLYQFVLYILDDKGILNHGTSIGGSWLTNIGKIYYDILKFYMNEYYEE